MHTASFRRLAAAVLLLGTSALTFSQSKPQKADPVKGTGKVNTRAPLQTEEERLKSEAERKLAEEEKKAVIDDVIERVETNVVNVDTVVYNKKTGQILTGLNRSNFAIFENGVKQEISNFATPESPITVSLVLEYSRWTEILGSATADASNQVFDEAVRPVAFSFCPF